MKLMLFRVFLPSSFFLKQTAKCICPSSVDLTADGGESKAHYSFTHNICVGPCPKGTHYEEGKKDCVIDTADCDKATGQIPGKVGNVAEGHCVCPENEYMIEGKKCGICTDPKNHFVPNNPDDKDDPIEAQKLSGTCQCPPDLPHFSEKKKLCYTCPEDEDGDKWEKNDDFADCEKKCPENQVWIRAGGDSKSGYCGCEKPLTLVDNQCVNCNDKHKGTIFVEQPCDPQKLFGSFQPCGKCKCPRPSVWSSTEKPPQCITCVADEMFNPDTGKCEPNCGDWSVTGRSLNDQNECECDPLTTTVGDDEIERVFNGKTCTYKCPDNKPLWEDCIKRNDYGEEVKNNDGQTVKKEDCEERCRPMSRADCQCNQCLSLAGVPLVKQFVGLMKKMKKIKDVEKRNAELWNKKWWKLDKNKYDTPECHMAAILYKSAGNSNGCTYAKVEEGGTYGSPITFGLSGADNMNAALFLHDTNTFHQLCTPGIISVEHQKCGCSAKQTYSSFLNKVCNAYIFETHKDYSYTYDDFKTGMIDIAIMNACAEDKGVCTDFSQQHIKKGPKKTIIDEDGRWSMRSKKRDKVNAINAINFVDRLGQPLAVVKTGVDKEGVLAKWVKMGGDKRRPPYIIYDNIVLHCPKDWSKFKGCKGVSASGSQQCP